MRRFTYILISILFISLGVKGQNDNCATPVALCANNTITGSNVGATTVAGDPDLDCGPSSPKATVWYTVTATSNGFATITVSNVVNNPGLTVEAYTGTCGSFTTTGQCATGTGTLSFTFATTTGTTYYIMVSGRGSNTETFNILATSSTNSLVARPDADFLADPTNGCVPLTVLLDNTSTIFGGTNITYQWQFDGGSFINSSGADTSITYSSTGTHTVTFKVGNNECGSKSVSQDIVVQSLVPTIGYSPSTTCLGTPVTFNGSASVLPNPPFVDPNITSWSWNFGDPNSGTNDSSSAQNPTHTFVGPGSSFNVQLIVQGTCGPDTATLTVNILPKPVLHPSADQVICQGSPATISATVSSATSPISYIWSGTPTITCDTCSSTTVTGLSPGGPYTYTINITDGHGCVADSATHVTVNPLPVVNAGNDTTVCNNSLLTLSPTVTVGNPPFTYSWAPTTGLNNATLKNPTATVTGPITYCITVKDSAGCTSDTNCMNISVFPKPTVSPSPTFFCSSDRGPNISTVTVSGAHAGSTYQWKLSPKYSLITGSNIDSSSITATLLTGVVANDSFIVIVNDPVTGCADTVPVSVQVIPGITLAVNGPFTICKGSSASLTASGATTYAWTASPSYSFADSTQADQTVSPLVNTIFIVEATSGSCSKTDSIIVTVNPIPVVNAGNDTTVCKNSLLTLSPTVTVGNPPFTYSWSPSSGLNSATLKNPTATITGPITYCVTVKDSIGCTSAPDCLNINIYPKPTVTPSPSIFCSSDPGPDVSTITVSGAHSGSTYQWKLSPKYSLITGSNIDSSSITATLLTGVVATDSFIVIVNDPVTGCADTVPVSIQVIPGVTLAVNGPFTICKGNSASLTASGATTYAWTASPSYSFADSTQAGQTVSPLVTTIFIVKGTTGTCSKTDSIHVTVNPIPVVNAGNDTTVCNNSLLTLTPTVTTGTAPFTYSWSPATGLNNDTLKNPTATVTGPITYCITVKDSIGCTSAPDCLNINIYPKPTVSASPTTYCASNPGPDTTTFAVSGAHPLSTYSWKLSPSHNLITGSNLDSSSVKATLPTGIDSNYNFIVIINDPVTGCADTVPVIFSVTNGISMSVNGPFKICTGQSASLIASGATQYAWTASPAYIFADSTQASQNVSPLVTTSFIVKGSTGACTKVDTIHVTVNPLPTAKADTIANFCGCSTVALNGTGSSPGMTYLWTSVIGSAIANPDSLVTTALICSSDVLTLTVTDTATGCSKSISVPAITAAKPVAVGKVTPSIICNGATTTVTLSGTGSNTSPGTIYHWSSVPVVPIADTTALSTTATVTGFTVFHLSVTNIVGCDSMITDTVNVYPPPTISASPGMLCTSNPLLIDTISILGASPGSTYNWTSIPGCVTPSATSAASQAFNFSTCGIGIYSFMVIVTDAVTGCVTTLNTSVHIVNGITLITSPSQAICQGDSVILFVSGANSYLWSNNATTDTIVVKGLTTAMSPDTFIVAGVVGSCIAVDTIIVTINPTPVTSAINGPTNVCANDTATIFNVTGHAGDIYAWAVTGGSITSGQGTDSIVVKWGPPGPATVTVHETSPFGCISADQTINVTINANPVTSPIAGDTSVCASTTDPYSVSLDAGSTYQWIAAGGTITSGQGTDSVLITWGAGPSGTIQVVETNAAACAGDTVSLNVTVLPLPAKPNIVGPDTLCADSLGVIYTVINHAGSYYLWNVNGGTIISPNDSINQISVNWGTAGTASVRVVEVNSNGCVSPADTLIIILDSIPVTSLITGNNSVCPNDSDIYSVVSTPGNTYTWVVTGGSMTSGQGTDSIKVSWPGAGAGIITVTEANPGGCKGTPQTLNVTINPKPVTSAIGGDTTACQNSTQPYTIVVTTGSTYQWTATGGIISGSATDTTVSIIWGTPPSGVVKVVETSAAGCSGDTVTLNVNILAAPALPVITGADTLCADSLGAIYSVANNAGSYYLWTVTGGTVVSPNDSTHQITVNWGNAGVDTIHVIEVNTNGCPSLPAIQIVKLDSVPATSAIAGDTSVCANDTAVIYSVNNTVGNIYNWTVTGGSVASGQGTDSIKVNWSGPGTDTIAVIETAPGGCSGMQKQLLVVIHSIPDSTRISGKDSACAGSTLSYTASGDTGSTFVWNATNGTIVGSDTASIISVTWGTAGTGLLQVIETSKYGCSATPVFLNMTVNPIPNTSPITGNDTICISDTGNVYFVAADSGSTYMWTLVGGTITSGQGTDSITTSWTNSGADSISVIESNYLGCAGTAVTKVVMVTAKPRASVSASKTTLCQNDTVHLMGIDSNAVSVKWHTSGSGSFSNDTTLSPVYTASAADSGAIVLTFVVHNPPCVDDSSRITLTVNPIPHVTITPPAPTVCSGDTDTLTVSGIGSYLWSPGNDTTSSIIVNPDSTVMYNVKVTNNYGCSAMDSVLITVLPPGIPTAGPNQSICRGDSVFLNGTIANAGGGVWTGSGNGAFVPNAFTLNATYIPGSNDTTVIQLVLTTTGACRNGSDTLKVTFNLVPIVNAGLDQTISYRDSAHLNGTVVNAGGGMWSSDGSGTFIPSDSTLNAVYVPSYTDLQQDSIILTLTSTNGCKVVRDFMVIHFNEFMIPNVFTPYPNSPGFNDFFEVKGLPPDSKLKIWNRWGLLVYESENYRNDWDGENVISDVYYYEFITPKNQYHGWVEVIK